jgi:hypothetical protein
MLKAGDPKEWYDLRTLEESTFVIGHNKERARIKVQSKTLDPKFNPEPQTLEPKPSNP